MMFRIKKLLLLDSYRDSPQYEEVMSRKLADVDGDEKAGVLLVELAKEDLDRAYWSFDSVETKAKSLTQASAGIGFLSLIVGRVEQLNALSCVPLFVFAVGLIAMSGVCGLLALWPRDIPSNPGADRVSRDLEKFGSSRMNRSRAFQYSCHTQWLKIPIYQKTTWVKRGYTCITLSLLMLFIFVLMQSQASFGSRSEAGSLPEKDSHPRADAQTPADSCPVRQSLP